MTFVPQIDPNGRLQVDYRGTERALAEKLKAEADERLRRERQVNLLAFVLPAVRERQQRNPSLAALVSESVARLGEQQ